MDIGLEIKLWRERKGLSGKELAQRLGLSPSQVSRIEKGQRRVNAETLQKIAEVLDVSPAVFFKEEEEERWRDLDLRMVWREVGKVIRAERHRRHLSPEEVAQKLGKTKGFVLGLEEGRYPLDPELAGRLAKALKLDPLFFLRCQHDLIKRLIDRITRLEQAHAEVTLGNVSVPERGGVVPVVGGLSGEYPEVFDAEGLPVDTVSEYVYVSGIDPETAFALYTRGDAMVGQGPYSFADGDILVFSRTAQPRNRDFVFVRSASARPTFRQVFFDKDGRIRLQPLNLSYPPLILPREEIIRMWPLLAQVKRF